VTASVDSRTSGEDERRVLCRDPNPHLFRPLRLRSITVKNRIMLSPMCQYSAVDGLANDWHFAHLAGRAMGGVGIVCTEAVHTQPAGRITRHDLGLWNDAQRDRLTRIVDFIVSQGAVPAIQLGHAGRKASVGRPWEGAKPIPPADGGWEVVGPSPLAYAAGWPIPIPLSRSDITRSLDEFCKAARRAFQSGFQILEIHAAHGYLIHQFLSPLSNHRDDEYGGSFEHRIRLLRETVSAARSEWPSTLPLFLRISCADWVEGGWMLEDSLRLCRLLKHTGEVDLVDCSSGGNDPRQQIPIHPGYQIPFSADIRKTVGIMTGAVGLIHSPDLAESVLANSEADLVILGRTLLADPVWPLRAANQLKAMGVKWPHQYERGNIF
jgi:2,4-dienoyl-CoA reductase-like NADH-dependent reductase (Old Yellow Enzyme family)